ncbi:NAD(P)-dependent alcohol dehydrogenase [Actinocrispum sp. NPDC049592]|uniref:NAD(P)-dependent alcohol dehydrogenase n=1 Tax=Actinocrispum sp. NPDC049592 TaxID=3154835 RepID=UPI00342B7D7B
MKAIRYFQYGSPDVLELHDIPVPSIGPDEVLVQVRAASVNPLDWHFMRGDPYLMRLMFGLTRPKTSGLGSDFAGVVASAGSAVRGVKAGDSVFGCVSWSHGGLGSFAEYVRVPADAVRPKPASLSYEEAAAMPVAGLTALQAFRLAGLSAGQSVLINGAAGGVGTFAVQIARSMGADVTGVCSTGNVSLVSSLGACAVIDYTSADFVQSGPYDVVLDNAGSRSLSACRRVLTKSGVLLSATGAGGHWVGGLARVAKVSLMNPFVSQRMVVVRAEPSAEDLASLAELVSSGSVTPFIDRTYTLDSVAKAVDYVEQGHARGKVIITV